MGGSFILVIKAGAQVSKLSNISEISSPSSGMSSPMQITYDSESVLACVAEGGQRGCP